MKFELSSQELEQFYLYMKEKYPDEPVILTTMVIMSDLMEFKNTLEESSDDKGN